MFLCKFVSSLGEKHLRAANELMNERTPAKMCQDRMIPVKSSSAGFELFVFCQGSRTGLVGRDIISVHAYSYAALSGYTCIVEQAGDLRRVAVAKREQTGSLVSFEENKEFDLLRHLTLFRTIL